MPDLRELYQEVIFDHNRRPRNFRELPGATGCAEGFNPLCGDRVTVYVKLEDGVIREASFQGRGCAISTASASLMTESLIGKTPAQAQAIFREFHDLVTGGAPHAAELGKLQVLAGVREFPSRVKCATLAWHTMQSALLSEGGEVTTE